MQANARPVLQEDVEKRKEKERKREEKELRKLAKAAGIKMAKPSTLAPAAPVFAPITTADTPSATETKLGGFKKAGWASIGTSSKSVETGRRAARSTVDSTTPSSSRPPSPPGPPSPVEPEPIPPPPKSTPPPPPSHPLSNAPSFRAGGWSTLDTGSSTSLPPAPAAPTALPPPPPPSPPTHALLPPPPVNELHPPPQPPSLPGPAFVKKGWAPVSSQPIQLDSSSLSQSVAANHPLSPAAPSSQEGKSGWQQWKQSKKFKQK